MLCPKPPTLKGLYFLINLCFSLVLVPTHFNTLFLQVCQTTADFIPYPEVHTIYSSDSPPVHKPEQHHLLGICKKCNFHGSHPTSSKSDTLIVEPGILS